MIFNQNNTNWQIKKDFLLNYDFYLIENSKISAITNFYFYLTINNKKNIIIIIDKINKNIYFNKQLELWNYYYYKKRKLKLYFKI